MIRNFSPTNLSGTKAEEAIPVQSLKLIWYTSLKETSSPEVVNLNSPLSNSLPFISNSLKLKSIFFSVGSDVFPEDSPALKSTRNPSSFSILRYVMISELAGYLPSSIQRRVKPVISG